MHGIGWEKRKCSSLDAVAAAGGYAARWNGGVADAGSAVEHRVSPVRDETPHRREARPSGADSTRAKTSVHPALSTLKNLVGSSAPMVNPIGYG